MSCGRMDKRLKNLVGESECSFRVRPSRQGLGGTLRASDKERVSVSLKSSQLRRRGPDLDEMGSRPSVSGALNFDSLGNISRTRQPNDASTDSPQRIFQWPDVQWHKSANGRLRQEQLQDAPSQVRGHPRARRGRRLHQSHRHVLFFPSQRQSTLLVGVSL